jgi:hypothetical protein
LLDAESNYQGIRCWDSAVRAAERQRWRGHHGITIRLVLRALGAAAQLSGGMVIEFGTRSLGMLACLDHSTVARVLQELRDEDDAFIELMDSGRDPGSKRSQALGDLYLLRIPEAYVTAAAWRRWRPGRMGVHPVFRVLGGPAALVYEQLGAEPVRTIDLPVLTGLSATAVSSALADLAVHALAARGPGGWRRGAATADSVADRLGVPELLRKLQDRYRLERQKWHGVLMVFRSPPATADPGSQVPLPDSPADDDPYPDLAEARGPPADVDVLALLEEHLGPVQVIAARESVTP